MAHTFVIAEAGSTHEGSSGRMQRLVWLAKLAGADAVKFQWTSRPADMAQRRHAGEWTEAWTEAYRMLAWPHYWLTYLTGWCQQAEIELMCTVYLPEDIARVALYVTRFKVASLEASNMNFVRAHETYGKPVIVSTGCMDEGEVDVLWEYKLQRAADGHPPVSLLHCTAAYPAPLAEMNLRLMLDGLSDHSGHALTGAVAAAAGAKIVEVHYRLDDTSPSCPDYGHSLAPAALHQYIANVRTAETLMGTATYRAVTPAEEALVPHKVRT